MRLYEIERPEIESWDFEQHAPLLAAAKIEGEDWYAGVCLAGEAGLRSGETKALRWREDVDLPRGTGQNRPVGDGSKPASRSRTDHM
jgi:integrase